MDHAALDHELATERANALLSVVQASCAVRTRAALDTWLQGSIQEFIPHAVVMVAWGDFQLGAISWDFVPCGPECAGVPLNVADVRSLMGDLFARWSANRQQPVSLEAADLRLGNKPLFPPAPGSRIALAHGLNDCRGEYDCLYVFIGPSSLQQEQVKDRLRLLLPSIDTGFRQSTGQDKPAPVATFSAMPEPYVDTGAREPQQPLSAREREVMRWVRLGKTNAEIAQIMNLSTFTVKNHMRRIYRKMDVLNRAQAVGRLGALA
jgi:transcriptional regulator EpsA